MNDYLKDIPTETLLLVKQQMLQRCNIKLNTLLAGMNEHCISDENIDNMAYYLKGVNKIIEFYNEELVARGDNAEKAD